MLTDMDGLLPTSVFGLPLHPLVVHAAVVIVPLTAAMVLLAAVLPRFRRWAGWLPPALAAGSVVLTRVATGSGADLQRQQAEQGTLGPLVAAHQALGQQLIWWVVGLLLVALATYGLERRERTQDRNRAPAPLPRWLTVVVAGAAVLLAVGTVVQTVRVGHSGAESVWSDPGGS